MFQGTWEHLVFQTFLQNQLKSDCLHPWLRKLQKFFQKKKIKG